MTVTVICPAGDCEHEHEIDVAYEPPEHGYGSDADGRRGITLPGYFYVESEIPETCPTCSTVYTPGEHETIAELAIEEAADDARDEAYWRDV